MRVLRGERELMYVRRSKTSATVKPATEYDDVGECNGSDVEQVDEIGSLSRDCGKRARRGCRCAREVGCDKKRREGRGADTLSVRFARSFIPGRRAADSRRRTCRVPGREGTARAKSDACEGCHKISARRGLYSRRLCAPLLCLSPSRFARTRFTYGLNIDSVQYAGRGGGYTPLHLGTSDTLQTPHLAPPLVSTRLSAAATSIFD